LKDKESVWGRILESPKGTKGFGFDPIVEFFDFPGRSVAELTMEEKGLISHRGQAIQNLAIGFVTKHAQKLRDWNFALTIDFTRNDTPTIRFNFFITVESYVAL
jgi:hypothetical protein